MTSDVSIGIPSIRDADDIAALFLEDMGHLGVRTDLEAMRSVATSVIDAMAQDRCVVRVARVAPDARCVGVLLAMRSWSLKFGGPSLWIEELYVTPDARRFGIGRRLVEHLLDWAEANDIHGVDLEAYQGNTPASILYRSIGFNRLGRERFYFNLKDSARF